LTLCVHDELVAECNQADTQQVADWLQRCMVDDLQPLLKHVPAVADVSVSRDWAGSPL
jgi:DNA polymerase I-like protein with 3'-5' exonuclease and polymerase domains